MVATSMLYLFARASAERVAVRGVRRAYFQLLDVGSHDAYVRTGIRTASRAQRAALTRDYCANAMYQVGGATCLRRTFSKEIAKRIP